MHLKDIDTHLTHLQSETSHTYVIRVSQLQEILRQNATRLKEKGHLLYQG